MLDRRVHYRRQNHYRTKSNKTKIVKTPGNFCPLLKLSRWQADRSVLEEIRWQNRRWHPQAQIPCPLKTHCHQENNR